MTSFTYLKPLAHFLSSLFLNVKQASSIRSFPLSSKQRHTEISWSRGSLRPHWILYLFQTAANRTFKTRQGHLHDILAVISQVRQILFSQTKRARCKHILPVIAPPLLPERRPGAPSQLSPGACIAPNLLLVKARQP